jgi:hypothetical protein
MGILFCAKQSCVPSVLVCAFAATALELPHPTTPGPNADFPPFMTEQNGVSDIPWGAGNYTWGQQLFWEGIPDLNNHHLQEMINGAVGMEAQGKVPIMSCVAWGYEYTAATGGDSAHGFGDKSRDSGWAQWGSWLKARKDKYFAQDWEGKIIYPHAGYVTPMMPLDSADWPPGIVNATFGDFAGWKIGTLANRIHSRGFYAADFVVGLYGGNHDFHPRVLDDFERWAGVDIPGATVTERAEVIRKSYWSLYSDFKSDRFARFYARAAETIRAAGREPLVGGQILPHAASVRGTGNDFRIYLKHLPAKNWYFSVELQSDEGRPVPLYWNASTNMGGHAARAPQFPMGAHMDAWQSNFNNAVKNAGKDTGWARKYLKHAWLSVGWTHVANTDGTVRRAPMAFNRAYWDAGVVDTPIVALVRKHIPRHPFGPAFYYSTDLERQSEGTGNPNFYYWFEPKTVGWRLAGVPGGYFVSDSSLSNLKPENRPSGWFVYVDNLGKTRLKDDERARLEAIAPILTESDIRDSCPVSFEGDSLGGFAYIDQFGSVIVVVSNAGEKPVEGNIHFAKVENGFYRITELLANRSQLLPIVAHKGIWPISMAGRDSRVFKIDGLRELGRKELVPWNGPVEVPPFSPGVLRPDGKRLDILGRRFWDGPRVIWTAPVP